MFLHNVLNLLHCHRSRRRGGVCSPIHRVTTNWNIAWTNRLLPTKKRGTSSSTDMPQLTQNQATFSVHGIGDLLPAGNLRSCENTRDTWVSCGLNIFLSTAPTERKIEYLPAD
jgi:hypothetical protein